MSTTYGCFRVRQINARAMEPPIVLNFGINDLQGCVFHTNATATILGSVFVNCTLLHDQFFTFHSINAAAVARGRVFSNR